jgi:arabinose-5-phosphate isomerase
MTLLVAKGFKEEDFANLHPGGKIGKRLMRVEQIMHTGDKLPVVRPTTPMREVVEEISRKGFGMTCVADDGVRLVGVITDGDLRRHMGASVNMLDRTAADIMSRNPLTVVPGTLAVEVLNVFEQRKITSIVVVGADSRIEGVVHLHDLWRTEVF